jgi:hypothetical protein
MAKTGKFRRSACERTFSMAAHLARHQSTMHAPKGRKKTAKKQVPEGAAGRVAGRVRRAAPRYRPAAGSVAGVISSLRGTVTNSGPSARRSMHSLPPWTGPFLRWAQPRPLFAL